MKDAFRWVLARYGQNVTVETAEGTAAGRAFLQPVTEKGEETLGEQTGIGAVDGRLWLYIGERMVTGGDTVEWNGARFRVRSGRPYAVGEETLYCWASLTAEKETE